MRISTVSATHPRISKRDITLVFTDNNIDLPSARFLVHDARYGGRGGHIAGRKIHRNKAIIMGELYRHLNEMGVSWREASEAHIIAIRNAMLHWDRNGNSSMEEYDYRQISNNAVNQKIEVWFRFYKHMDKIRESNQMAMTTEIVKVPVSSNYMNHIGKSTGYEFTYKERWAIKVKPDPVRNHHRAITHREYAQLEKHLVKNDIAFGMLAYIMVETGLRIEGALEVDESYFKSFLVHINAGKLPDDEVEMRFINKGGDIRECMLPIRVIGRMQKEYMVREHRKRKKLYKIRCQRLGKPYNENDIPLWINKKGKPVKYKDVLNAFRDASNKMGRKVSAITPHWMRHTFATWAFIEYSKEMGLDLRRVNDEIELSLSLLLQRKLVHATSGTLRKYVATALDLMGKGRTSGAIVTLTSLSKDKKTQERIREQAMLEFGNDFDEDTYDMYSYGHSRNFIAKGD